ncbi:MAG: hypothetical protein Q9N62_09160 [Ghiorsea sp.]|nr:hypothetical protein [Ghiorsea sp.]
MRFFQYFCLGICLSFAAHTSAYAQNTTEQTVSSFFQSLNPIATGAIPSQMPTPTRSLTPMLMLAQSNWSELSPATQALVNPWLARPTDGIAINIKNITIIPFTLAQESTWDSTYFTFHYTTTGANAATLNFVQQLAVEADKVWAKEIGTMAYNAPPSDGSLGGSGKYDIYLLDTGSAGVYGYVTSDASTYLGSPYLHSLYSHMVIDNDFLGFPQAPLDAAKVTLAHEFFHSIQFGYDPGELPAFSESTATWMEDKVYPTIKDNLQYIGEAYVDNNHNGQYDAGETWSDHNGNGLRESGSQDYPELPVDAFGRSPNGLEQYGRFMWIRYLSDKFGDPLIKTILTNTGITAGNNTYPAIDAALQTQGSSLATAFHKWGIWNTDINLYQNGIDYPITWVDNLVSAGINISNDSATVLQQLGGKQPHLSTVYERIQNPTGTFTFTSPSAALLSVMTQTTLGGAYTTTPIPLTAGQGSWAAPASIAMATFVISNTSATDNAMTWKLSDGVTPAMPSLTPTGPVYSDASGAISGNTGSTTTIISSSSSGGCLTSTPRNAHILWLWLLLVPTLLLISNKTRKPNKCLYPQRIS